MYATSGPGTQSSGYGNQSAGITGMSQIYFAVILLHANINDLPDSVAD